MLLLLVVFALLVWFVVVVMGAGGVVVAARSLSPALRAAMSALPIDACVLLTARLVVFGVKVGAAADKVGGGVVSGALGVELEGVLL